MSEILTSDHDGVHVITMNRPERANALTRAMAEELLAALRDAAAAGKRAVVLNAAGAAFCGGVDFRDARAHAEAGKARDFVSSMQHLERELAVYPGGLVAAVHGPAIGMGGEICVGVDAVVAGPEGDISFPEVGFGVSTGYATSRLARQVGEARARYILLAAGLIKPDAGVRIGLVRQAVASTDQVTEAAIEVAREIGVGDPAMIGWMKSQWLSGTPDVDVLTDGVVGKFEAMFADGIPAFEAPVLEHL